MKKLRDQTGAGMMECKAALTEANGDFEEANTILRKRGLATAAKKAGRATSEGLIGNRLAADGSAGVLVEVNCESDFVARTDDFQQLMQDVLTEIEKAGDAADQAWLPDPNGPVHKRLAAHHRASWAKTWPLPGSSAMPARVTSASTSTWAARSASRWSSRASRRRWPASAEFATLVKEVAMQIAASSPGYVSRAAVPADVLEKEKAIYRAQMETSGKPANVIDKIVEGKLGSFYAQVVLTDQASIRDPKMTVADVIAAASKALGATITVSRFARLRVGEGAQ